MDISILILQFFVGAAIFLGHGFPKLKGFSGTVQWFKSIGFGTAGAIWSSGTEGIASVLLALGIFPRIMAVLIGITMIGVLGFHIRRKDSFTKAWEVPYLFLVSMVVIALSGASLWGLIV